MELIVSIIAGILGGNGAGAVLKPFNLGMLGNSLAGLAGGLAGGQIAKQLDAAAVFSLPASTDAAGVMAGLVAAGIGGFCLTLLGGFLRQFASRR